MSRHGFVLMLPIATLLFACSDDDAPHDAGRVDAGTDAGTGAIHDAGTDAGRTRGAAADSGHVTHQCPNGEWIPSQSQCLQDDAFCFALAGDAGWCTGNVAPQCPPGSSPLEPGQLCPAGRTCFQYSESLHCMVGYHVDASIVDENGGPAPLEITVRGYDAQISAELGQEVDLLIGTVGPGRYEDPMLTSAGVAFLGVQDDPPGTGTPAGSAQEFRFRCVAAGTSVISIPHSESDHPGFHLVLQCG